MASLSTLPEELLLMIFRKVTTSDLLKVSAVCRKWRRLIHDHSLYERLIIDDKLKSDVVARILHRYADIVSYVVLKNRGDVNDILPLLARCSNLTTLKLISCQGQVHTTKMNRFSSAQHPLIRD